MEQVSTWISLTKADSAATYSPIRPNAAIWLSASPPSATRTRERSATAISKRMACSSMFPAAPKRLKTEVILVFATPSLPASSTARTAELALCACPTTRQRSHCETAEATESLQKVDVSAKTTSASPRRISISFSTGAESNSARSGRSDGPHSVTPGAMRIALFSTACIVSSPGAASQSALRSRSSCAPITSCRLPNIRSRSSTAARSPIAAATWAIAATSVVLPVPPRPAIVTTSGARVVAAATADASAPADAPPPSAITAGTSSPAGASAPSAASARVGSGTASLDEASSRAGCVSTTGSSQGGASSMHA